MIYFVGAGPGDVTLITVKGQKLIEQADVIIYAGSLVNPALLEKAKDGAKIYNSAHMTLDEVAAVMQEADGAGLDVVRLHTGDTSLYSTITEQIKRLEQERVSYAVVPGVSSFSAAAAALGIQYTLPEVSQSLVITRREGRTAVPEKEKLKVFAEIGCSLVLFLSASMAEQIQADLLKEGSAYTSDTPCAVCYRVSWEDEKILRTTLGELPSAMEAAGINKTALIIVGDVLDTDRDITESKLYAPDFSTGYRSKKGGGSASFISFTDAGIKLGERLSKDMPQLSLYSYGRDFKETKSLIEGLFSQDELIIISGACGMAVRLIAPFIKSKATDPAVLVVDDLGHHVISLLSGHLGGSNEWCKKVAEYLGAEPVITTATDNHGVFAVDEMAREKDLVFEDTSSIREVSSRLLRGEQVGYYSDCGINITEYLDSKKQFKKECRLYPKNVFVGMGCKAGKSADELHEFLTGVFDENRLPLARICGIFSIDKKADEQGLIELAKRLGTEFTTFSPEELSEAQGDFSHSDFVLENVGVDNVCERAAIYAASCGNTKQANLLINKTKSDGMTIALAVREM